MLSIQNFFKSAGDGSCLALSYIRAALGKDATPQMMIDALYKAAERNIVNVKKDCFVEDAIALMKVANPKKVYSVIKKDVSSIAGIKLGAVRYSYNGYSHWVLVEDGKIVFTLDNLSGPGNLGTRIRTLDSPGINSLILSKGSADLYNPKVVRSTMGAIFRIDAEYAENLQSKLLNLKEQGYKIIVTSLQADKYIYDLPFKEKCVVVIGNESKGVSEKIMELADIKTKIPMLGRTESLNAAVAASIMAYEAVRQNFVG